MTTSDLFVEKLEEHRRLMAMKPRDDDEATALVRRMIAIEDSLGDDPPRTREGVIAGLHFVAEHAPAYEIDVDLIVTLMDAAIEWIEGEGLASTALAAGQAEKIDNFVSVLTGVRN